MITSIQLRDFQSHRNTRLDLSPGVNVIVGSGNHGKTAILRALRWACYNQGPGLAAIRHGRKSCKVVVGLAEGVKIVRERGRGRNRVRIVHKPSGTKGRKTPSPDDFKGVYGHLDAVPGLSGAGTLTLDAVGVGMPERAARLLSLPEANWQSQMDGPFLLSGSGRDAAEAINDACGLGLIVKATDAIKQRSNQVRRKLSQAEQRAATLDDRLSRFSGLRKAASLAKVVKKLVRSIRQRASVAEQLAQAIADVERQRAQFQRPDPLPVLEAIAACETTHAGIIKRREQAERLQSAVNEVERSLREAAAASSEAKAETKQLNEAVGDHCPYCGAKLRKGARP